MSEKNTIAVAPLFRFLVELTAWIWLIWKFWYLFIINIVYLTLFNAPGDKQPIEEGTSVIAVPGFVRILLEISTIILGIYAINEVFGIYGVLFQTFISIIAVVLDFNRWLWLLGMKDDPPEYVIATHKKPKKM